jgi:hypothetical protein
METIEFAIHDSTILSVIENTQNNTLDFIIDYPVDYDNNVYCEKTLRFYEFLNYEIKEIPFATQPVLLDFNDLGEINYTIGEERNKIEIKRRKIELITNAGKRLLDYQRVDLLDNEKK